MDAIDNFRELGGLAVAAGSIRPGVLYRSGHLANATEADHQRLRELGVRTIVDLRTDADIDGDGEDRVPPGIDHRRVPIRDDAGRGDQIRSMVMRGDLDEIREVMGDGRGHAMATEGAAGFVSSEERMASFGQVMEIVTDPDSWPVLWHCSAGKDRAGWIGTSVLLGLGARTDVVISHYLESNVQLAGIGALFPEGEMKDLLRPFLEVHEDFVRAQLDIVGTRWGDVGGLYREGFGLADHIMDRLGAAVDPG